MLFKHSTRMVFALSLLLLLVACLPSQEEPLVVGPVQLSASASPTVEMGEEQNAIAFAFPVREGTIQGRILRVDETRVVLEPVSTPSELLAEVPGSGTIDLLLLDREYSLYFFADGSPALVSDLKEGMEIEAEIVSLERDMWHARRITIR